MSSDNERPDQEKVPRAVGNAGYASVRVDVRAAIISAVRAIGRQHPRFGVHQSRGGETYQVSFDPGAAPWELVLAGMQVGRVLPPPLKLEGWDNPAAKMSAVDRTVVVSTFMDGGVATARFVVKAICDGPFSRLVPAIAVDMSGGSISPIATSATPMTTLLAEIRRSLSEGLRAGPDH